MPTKPAPAVGQSSESNQTTSTLRSRTFATRFVDFWWVTIPAKLRQYSVLLWAAWSDGIYLTAWPRVATVLVFAVFLFGFVEGGTHWRYRTIVGTNGFAGNVLAPMATANDWGGPTGLVFADNLLLLMVAVGLGSLSANLGITLVLGYALGDILWAGPAPPDLRFNDVIGVWICRYVPLIVSYLLFFLLASLPILMAMELARSSHRRVNQSKATTVGLTAIIEAALIYCWSGMAPMVFRTVQLWAGGDPRITVPFYMQITATWLIPVAVVAVLVRALLFRLAARRESFLARDQALALRFEQTVVRTPPWARAIIAAGAITLLMTGFLGLRKNWAESALFSNYLEGYVVFFGLAAALLLHTYFLPRTKRWQRWTDQVEQYPAVLRLAAATVASYVLTVVLMEIPGLQSTKPNEFGPEVASILVGLGLTLVLLPRGWAARPVGNRLVPWRRLPVPSGRTQAAFIAAIILLATKKAFGDCNDCSCCFTGCLPGIAAAAAAGTIPGLGGLAGGLGAGAQKGASDPCMDYRRWLALREQEEQQADQDWLTADSALSNAIQNQIDVVNKLQTFWSFNRQVIVDGFGSAGAAEVSQLPPNIGDWTQNDFDSLQNWIADHLSEATGDPLFYQALGASISSMGADSAYANSKVDQATKALQQASDKLQAAKNAVQNAQDLLAKCEAAGHA